MTNQLVTDGFPIYPEEWFHLHGKALSGLRHSHPLVPGEDPDRPDHCHEASGRVVRHSKIADWVCPNCGHWAAG